MFFVVSCQSSLFLHAAFPCLLLLNNHQDTHLCLWRKSSLGGNTGFPELSRWKCHWRTLGFQNVCLASSKPVTVFWLVGLTKGTVVFHLYDKPFWGCDLLCGFNFFMSILFSSVHWWVNSTNKPSRWFYFPFICFCYRCYWHDEFMDLCWPSQTCADAFSLFSQKSGFYSISSSSAIN